jgi:hypothetical protein
VTASSTVQLRLRGLTWRQLASSAVAAAPLGYAIYLTLAHQHGLLHLQPWLLALYVAVAALPWLSLWAARATYRAKCDDVAVHVRGEALPYKTIRELRVERTPRRTTLHLVRSEDIRLQLVLYDAFAGRLEPLTVLRERLAAYGLRFEV